MNVTGIDWSGLQAEATRILSDLVRMNTVNPPGQELACANYLADILRREGLAPVVVESAAGRGSVVCRVRGGGDQKPLILLSHLDVVAVEPDKWLHDPFGGEVIDGYLWGRGTLDCKGLTAIELTALLALVRQGVAFKRDVIFAATADEETGGALGAGWLVANHRDLVDGEWCINEGGGEAYTVGGRTLYTCETAEKGTARFKVTAKGPAGHGSIPREDNAVILLSKAMVRLGEAHLPLHRSATMDGLLTVMGSVMQPPLSLEQLLKLGDDREALRRVLPRASMANMIYAMLHNTATPTILKAGERINVIPSVAEGWVDGRILPGQNRGSFLEEIRDALGDLAVEVTWVGGEKSPGALESPSAGALYDVIRDVMAQHEPDGLLAPFMLTGGTDAKHLEPAGVRVYGFWPMLEDPNAQAMELVHNHNERISVKNLGFGSQVLYDIIRRFCVD
jgi:acetylornithine deacetylase/succinyl-diaminopimelate desuccinylase-like protein